MIHSELIKEKPKLLGLLRNKQYKDVLGCITAATRKYMIPRTDYDMYNISPYSSDVSKAYGMEYINASFVNIHGCNFIASQHPKPVYFNRFIDFIIRARIKLKTYH